MSERSDTILIVDDDTETRALLREQVFSSPGFQVLEAHDGPEALQVIRQRSLDLIVLDLELPGLSGRDMLVALRSLGYRGPLIVLAESRSQYAAVEMFRLGATDYVTKPIREAEVLAAVERGLGEVRLRRQRDSLVVRLQATNQQLERRVQELTTLHDIGHAATALDNLDVLFRRVLESASALTGSDQAFLLLRDEKSGQLILRAGQNLPLAMLDRMGEAIQDSLAEMVLSSRETLLIGGDDLHRFAAVKGLYAVIYVPLVVQKTVIGVLAVANHQTRTPFSVNHEHLLRALASYVSIAIISTRLSYLLEQRSNTMKEVYREFRERDAQRGRHLQMVLAGLHQPLIALEAELVRLAQTIDGKNVKQTRQRLILISQRVRQLITQIAALDQRATDGQPGDDN
jgi:two-component system response regulator RstA